MPGSPGYQWPLYAVAVAALMLSATSDIASSQSFDRRAWQEDYATLKQSLEKRYSNLAWFASPDGRVDLPALDRRTEAALRIAENDEDARSALLSFVRGFHDGHFSQVATQDAARTEKVPTPAALEYTRSDPAGGCAALNYAPYDRPQLSLPFESLAGFRLVADGIATPFRAGIFTNGESHVQVGIVRIPSFEEASDVGQCMKAWARADVWRPDGKLLKGVLRSAVERDWYESLAGLLTGFKSQGVMAVLVDVGNNSGGDDSGDIAARLFTTKPLRSAPLWLSQDSSSSTAYFNEEIDALKSVRRLDSAGAAAIGDSLAAFEQRKAQLPRDACRLEWVWTERRAWSNNSCRRLVAAGSAGGPLDYLAPDAVRNAEAARELHWPAVVSDLWGSWSGPLYVLADARTYSAAEMFVAVLQNNGAAKVIGVRTGGDGCGFMDSSGLVTLPHSRLRFRVPNCVRMRADGTSEVAGVSPDIPVLPTEGEGARERAMRTLTELFADMHRK